MVLSVALVCADYIRPCYVSLWARYRTGRGNFSANNYVPGLCTHILYAFVNISSDWTLVPTESGDAAEYAQYKALKSSDPSLKFLFSVGGGSFPASRFSEMAANVSSRSTFVKSVISYVNKYGYDGADIDWEAPEDDADKANFVTLIKELKQAGGPTFLVTAAVKSKVGLVRIGYNIPELAKYFDFVNVGLWVCAVEKSILLNVMTYDFHGEWENVTGHNSALFSTANDPLNAASAMKYWADNGMPKAKLIVGVGAYTRGWTLKSNAANQGLNSPATGASKQFPYTHSAGHGAYFEVCELLKSDSGYRRHWDDVRQVPWLENGDQWLSYDDVESVTVKVKFIKENGYGGAFVWAIDMDDFNGMCPTGGGVRYPLLGVIARELGGKIVQ